ncbi:MAG: hypothetical protein JO298_06275, partial [Verrucomicrobia bacterium]|nr:hypothetical protein [Verrucomicrobiota bacterium]
MANITRTPRGFFRPPFIVGITGHMDLDPASRDRVKSEVKHFFTWLRASPRKHDDNEGNLILGPSLGLENTPIILLSSMAPGADQWVAEAAKEMKPPLRVLAPLPFLKDQYLEASTFKAGGVCKDKAASEFLAQFPDDDVFVVRLLDETDLDDDALRAKHKDILTGPSGKKERDRRYAAAGEYVAAYSDILIALTDKPIGQAENGIANPDENSGARAIAELKRRGVTPGLLPILPTLSWVDNGPVLHLYAPRKSKEGLGDAVKPDASEAKLLELLYPYDCRPPGISEKEDHNPQWLKAGHDILKAIAEHLERLNTEEIFIDPAREDGAFVEMLPAAAHCWAEAPENRAVPLASSRLGATLDRLARLRRRIADYSAYYNAHLTRLKRSLFGLAFASALSFALADNWDAKSTILPAPQIFFVIAIGLTLAAWIVYFCFKKTG